MRRHSFPGARHRASWLLIAGRAMTAGFVSAGIVWVGIVTVGIVLSSTTAAAQPTHDPYTVHIFHDNDIHFAAGDSSRHDTDFVRGEDNGRVITRTVTLPMPDYPVRIMAQLSIRPIPQDIQSVHDKWDRAGNVRLTGLDGADLEVVKFITAYGGVSDYRVDVTHLAPLLIGVCTFRGFVDTWVTPAWKMDFSLVFEPVGGSPADSKEPNWVESLLYEEGMSEEQLRDGPVTVEVEIPHELERITMHYLVSGHCTDGRGADEFVSKANVITIDSVEVHRFKPWRDDCRRFREVNPYCRRWSDGSWSSDYSRSGWCPGDRVEPIELELTEYLPPGGHVLDFTIEDVRPRNEEGHLGYWRVSSYLLGWMTTDGLE